MNNSVAGSAASHGASTIVPIPPYATKTANDGKARIAENTNWETTSVVQMLKQKAARITEIEREFLKTNIAYPINEEQGFSSNMSVAPEQLRNDLYTRFYDADFMKKILAFSRSVFIHDPSRSFDTYRLRKWLDNIKTLKLQNTTLVTEGGALSEGDTFIVKTLAYNGPDKKSEVLHEFFVGTACINKLRNTVLNFSMVLGAFECGTPVVEYDEPKICVGENDALYIVYEKIPEYLDMNHAIPQMDLNVYICTVVQILLALQVAFDEFKFTHYDLHTSNVRIRILDGKYSIPYPTRKGRIFINTNFLPTIIDYGMAYVEYNGEHFGSTRLMEYDIAPRPFPAYDIYKLLCMSLLAKPSDDIKNFIRCIAVNFILGDNSVQTIDQIDKFAKDQHPSFYMLPRTEAREKLQIVDVLNEIARLYPLNFKTDQAVNPLLNCSSGACKPCSSLTACKDKDVRLGDYPENAYDASVYILTKTDLPTSLYPNYISDARRMYYQTMDKLRTVDNSRLSAFVEIESELLTLEQIFRTLSVWAGTDDYLQLAPELQKNIGLVASHIKILRI